MKTWLIFVIAVLVAICAYFSYPYILPSDEAKETPVEQLETQGDLDISYDEENGTINATIAAPNEELSTDVEGTIDTIKKEAKRTRIIIELPDSNE